jgi:hypothetical protein
VRDLRGRPLDYADITAIGQSALHGQAEALYAFDPLWPALQATRGSGIIIFTHTLTRERRDNPCRETAAFLAENNLLHLGKYFVFGSLKEISFAHPATIFQPVLQRRGSSDFFAVFSNLTGKAQLA